MSEQSTPPADPERTATEPNVYDNSRPLDVHRWSEYPEVRSAVDAIYEELIQLPEFSGREKDNKRHLRVVLMDLLHCNDVDPVAFVGYSRNANKFSTEQRYNKLRIKYRALIRVIDGLTNLGYVEGVKGFRDPRSGISRQARMRATSKLLDVLADKYHVIPTMISRAKDVESIVMRDKDKNETSYKDTSRIAKMRAVVDRYNNCLDRTYADIRLRGYEGRRALHIDLNRNKVRRIFNNNSWKQGGRFHGGWWQNIPRELRLRITMQDKPTVEVDYSAMHIVILFAMEGIDYFDTNDGDPYLIDEFPNDAKHRALFKLVLLTCLNASSKTSAKQAIRHEMRETPDDYPDSVDLDTAIKAFEVKHAPIAGHFYSGIGNKLQYYDSVVAEKVIEYFTEEGSVGIAPLVVHDSFIVRRGLEDELRDVMEESLRHVLKNEIGGKAAAITPRLKTKTWEIHDIDSDQVEAMGLIEILKNYDESDLHDKDQIDRRKRWNETKRYPPVVFEPIEERQEGSDMDRS